jgi:RNA polymerase sigma-70 factor (ECF subfamily)
MLLQDELQLKDFLCTGDYSSVESFIRTYEDSLYGLCRYLTGSRHDADDLYQQTWLKAIQNSKSYRHKSFRNWLYTICINTYRDQRRKANRREKVTDDLMDAEAKEYAIASATDGVSAESIAIANFDKQQLVELETRLPDKHRLPIVLHYFEDMDYIECASVLNVPVGTIKSRLNTAKKKLLEEMEKPQD